MHFLCHFLLVVIQLVTASIGADNPMGVGDAMAMNALNQPHGRALWSNLGKQSGIPNVRWDQVTSSWVVDYQENVFSSAKKTSNSSKSSKASKPVRRLFPVKRYMKHLAHGQRQREVLADAAALEAAKAYRMELVKKGFLKDVSERRSSPVPGVLWMADRKRWRVTIQKKAEKSQKHDKTMKNKKNTLKTNIIKINGGCFKDQAAAEAKALSIAKQLGLQRQVKSVRLLSELPVVQPKVPCRGVKWNQAEQKWRIQCRNAQGTVVNFRVTPRNHSETELERSFQEAVAWKEKQQQGKSGKSGKSKAKAMKVMKVAKVAKLAKVARAKVKKGKAGRRT